MKPEWIESEYGTSYEDIVESWGYSVVSMDQTGSYQGDYEVLLRDSGRWGVTVFGYGSCSGCDALDGAQPWEEDGDWSEVEELRESLLQSITWFDSADDAVAWLSVDADGNDWWRHDSEIQGVFARYIDTIRGAE